MKYDYTCQDCELTFETEHPMLHEGPVACPECAGENTHKVISAPASVLDWYDSDSVHSSTRFRPPALNQRLRRREVE